jgi:pimeloyl-ACP methyl ester carboxylesterase
MIRRLFRILLGLLLAIVLLGLIAAAVGPLLVDPTPARGKTSSEALQRPRTGFVEVPFPGTDGLRLHVAERSASAPDAPTFVLLHGFTFNLYTWDRLTEGLAARGRVAAYDQIPYGLSAKPLPGTWSGKNPYSKVAALAQLMALLEARGIEQAYLVGNSSGGTLALEAARAYPERVRGLILLAPWVNSKRPILPRWLVDLPQMDRLTLLLARKRLVFGASGYIGSHLVPRLLEEGIPVRASSRNRAVLEARGWPGAELVEADALDPASLDRRWPASSWPTTWSTPWAPARTSAGSTWRPRPTSPPRRSAPGSSASSISAAWCRTTPTASTSSRAATPAMCCAAARCRSPSCAPASSSAPAPRPSRSCATWSITCR